jgi:hypothetical protein
MKQALINNSIIKLAVLLAAGYFSMLLTACTPSPGEGADPGIVDLPIAYTKRTILVDEDGDPVTQDVRRPLTYRAGGDLFLKQRSSVSSAEKNITGDVTNGIGDVRDVESFYDGSKLVFSLRIDDPDDNGDNENTWVIYEYDIPTEILRPVVPEGANPGDDIAPHYLPDGRIVFSSNRQHNSSSVNLDESSIVSGVSKGKYSILDENRRTKALNLHVMDAGVISDEGVIINAGGTNIKQISNNQSHDLDPTILPNGKILFSRWDHAGANNTMSLYTVNPDGSDLEIYYGAHSASHPDGMQFVQPRVMPDGKVLVLTQQFRNTFGGVDLFTIDGAGFVDNNQPVQPLTVNQGITGPAQVKATTANISNEGISLGGRYSSAFPLDDGSGRMLVSKGSCQLTNDIIDPDDENFDEELAPVIHPCIEPYISDPLVNEMPPVYGIWMNDPSKGTELPVVLPEPGKFITDIIGVSSRARPALIQDKGQLDLDQSLNDREGILNIRSVYDFGGGENSFDGCFLDDCISSSVMANITTVRDLFDPAVSDSTDLPARFLRIVKAVGICDPDDAVCTKDVAREAFGRDGRLGMREIIGYTMIQPDGSVRVKVPANVAFYIEVLDKNGRRIQKRETNGRMRPSRHDNWLQVRPKDTLQCTGCHTHEQNVTPLPHARVDAVETQIISGLEGDAIDLANTSVYGSAETTRYFGDTGDTLAEILTRQFPAALTPSIDLLYVDVWTDPNDAALTVEAPMTVRYNDLDSSTKVAIQPLVAPECLDLTGDLFNPNWDAACRMVINYPDHINPIWSVLRTDPAGEVDNTDYTCTNCHAKTDVLGVSQVPASFLDLSLTDLDDDSGDAIHLESYRELFFNDNRQEVVGNNPPTDIMITTLVPRVDDNGDPVLDPASCSTVDENNDPILDPATCTQIIDTVMVPDTSDPQTASMNANGARANFFVEKMTGETLNVSNGERNRVTWSLTPAVNHVGMLTPSELKLIYEWMDIGAQYYNNPVHANVPED